MSIIDEKRLRILNLLSEELKSWDGTSKHADEITAENKKILLKLQEVDDSLNQQTYTEAAQYEVIKIISYQKKLLKVIKEDRINVLNKMKQVNQKNKIVDNYYSSFQQSIFVDKGM